MSERMIMACVCVYVCECVRGGGGMVCMFCVSDRGAGGGGQKTYLLL